MPAGIEHQVARSLHFQRMHDIGAHGANGPGETTGTVATPARVLFEDLLRTVGPAPERPQSGHANACIQSKRPPQAGVMKG
jgi:hypothetical protein